MRGAMPWALGLALLGGVRAADAGPPYERIEFAAPDGLTVTADLYAPHPKSHPIIVLFHQAGWSRGAYRDIAPRLNRLGFNALAVDARSGEGVLGVPNETARRAKQRSKRQRYWDAVPDLRAALKLARRDYAAGPVVGWGSSYSASLVLWLAADTPGLMDGVVAFSPGAYFRRRDPKLLHKAMRKIRVPVWLTSARKEVRRTRRLFRRLRGRGHQLFVPPGHGAHGSRALWTRCAEHAAYWTALEGFLARFAPGPSRPSPAKQGPSPSPRR